MPQPYLLELEGRLAGRFFDFSGGMAQGNVVEGRTDSGGFSHKHLAGVKFEDMVLACGTGMSHAFYDWLGSTFDGAGTRHDGAVIPLDSNSKPRGRLSFYSGLVSSLVLPELDVSQKASALLTVSIKPERTTYTSAADVKDMGLYTGSSKAWYVSNFRLQIEGLDTECRHVTHVKKLSLGETIVPDVAGDSRSPASTAGALEFSNLILEVPGNFADGFFKWHDDSLVKGIQREKEGSIDFLAPGSDSPYFSLKLSGLGIFGISAPRADPSKPQTGASITVQIYCSRMSFSAGAGAVK